MFPEPTELLLNGCLIESIWTPRSKSNTLTPKINSQTYWQRKFHTWWMESSFVFVQHQPFQFHQLSWSDVEKNTRRYRWRKSHSKIEADDEFGLAIQRKGSELACLDCIGKPGENQIWKSSTSELVERAATKKRRPVMGASSSDYSEWNIDDKWSSQEWKSGEMLGARKERPVDDKFVIDNDDMDSDTATESNLSLKSRSFLHRVNDRLRKILDHSSKDAMQDIDKRSLIWKMFMSSTLEASVLMERTTQKIYIPSKIQGRILLWNRCLTYLKSW